MFGGVEHASGPHGSAHHGADRVGIESSAAQMDTNENGQPRSVAAKAPHRPGRAPGIAIDLVVEAAGGDQHDAAIWRASNHAGPILDRRAIAECARTVRELGADLDEAEATGRHGEALGIRARIEEIEEHVGKSLRLGGRSRDLNDPMERARIRVTRGIGSTVEKIRHMDVGLAHHLATHLRTGAFCTYAVDPERPIKWTL
jgi:non-specific serine/threonine protein kinase